MIEAGFVEVMECAPEKTLPEGPGWSFEVKLDGFRIEAVKVDGAVTLFSRNRNSLNRKFFYIADALSSLPGNTVVDGELVALDPEGRSSFTLIQSFRSQAENIFFYAFDLLFLDGRDLRGLPLHERRELLRQTIPDSDGRIRLSRVEATAEAMLAEVKARKLEGVIAKHEDSLYESGERSGSWVKHRVNQAQEFVVGGFAPGTHGFEALVVGFYRGADLVYVSRIRAGFDPPTRREVFRQLEQVERVEICPFVNLPQPGSSRWGGEGFTEEKMRQCVWLKPQAVAQVEFLEWSGGDHLRHARFVGMRDDKEAKDVVKES